MPEQPPDRRAEIYVTIGDETRKLGQLAQAVINLLKNEDKTTVTGVLCIVVDSWEGVTGCDFAASLEMHRMMESSFGRRPGPKLTKEKVMAVDLLTDEQKKFLCNILDNLEKEAHDDA